MREVIIVASVGERLVLPHHMFLAPAFKFSRDTEVQIID